MSKFIEITTGITAGDPLADGHTIISSNEYNIFDASTNPTGTNNATISDIIVSNNHTGPQTISIYLYEKENDNTVFYFIKEVVVPANTSFVWDEEINFDVSKHDLKLYNDASPTDQGKLTVIIN
jgi:hypothetical protein